MFHLHWTHNETYTTLDFHNDLQREINSHQNIAPKASQKGGKTKQKKPHLSCKKFITKTLCWVQKELSYNQMTASAKNSWSASVNVASILDLNMAWCNAGRHNSDHSQNNGKDVEGLFIKEVRKRWYMGSKFAVDVFGRLALGKHGFGADHSLLALPALSGYWGEVSMN